MWDEPLELSPVMEQGSEMRTCRSPWVILLCSDLTSGQGSAFEISQTRLLRLLPCKHLQSTGPGWHPASWEEGVAHGFADYSVEADLLLETKHSKQRRALYQSAYALCSNPLPLPFPTLPPAERPLVVLDETPLGISWQITVF